jgi:transcription initiation factor TFIIH subunit 3
MLSPRVLIIQASPDRTSDYNALMNCAFAANKSEIVIDGCFVPSGTKDDRATSSPYLQQLVDRTGGVYLSVPSGAAQVGGALSEVLVSVFLPPPSVRGGLNLPRLHNVDFRARCFETGESVDVAQICNQCLSIFKERPRDSCLTCGAMVRKKLAGGSNGGAKKMKLK